jgi:hypothetical protein
MRRNLRAIALYTALTVLLILSACYPMTDSQSGGQSFLVTPAQAGAPCEACAQATLAALLTQQKGSVDNQAAATAEIVRANAQATLNSVDATVRAAQTQEQNNANIVAAQIAATAEIVRANAQATLSSAGSTQSAALTQDAIQQTQMAAQATTGAGAVLDQQYRGALAAGTQTAVANNIATQTQAAAATSQWYVGQALQREERRQGPISFLWMWCLPAFLVLFAGLVLWGFWRWLKIQQANQRILENPVDRLPAPRAEVIDYQPDDSLQNLESDIMDSRDQVTEPDDQVRRWLDEVKRKLRSSDQKDKDDDADN